MREAGTVIAIDAGTARVAMEAVRHAQCGSCSVCRREGGGKVVTLDAPAPEGLAVGDHVIVDIPGSSMTQSLLLLLVVPLVLFMVGVLLGEGLRGRGVISAGSWASLLMGLAFMVFAYLAAGLYDRHLRRSPHHQPRIVEVNSPADR